MAGTLVALLTWFAAHFRTIILSIFISKLIMIATYVTLVTLSLPWVVNKLGIDTIYGRLTVFTVPDLLNGLMSDITNPHIAWAINYFELHYLVGWVGQAAMVVFFFRFYLSLLRAAA
ncbi:hypothetical protein FJQ54_13065 [Sandaracinobacter neustonicus]|uniref:Uncharacterized protein n=1 Tax=Sandaracinobacter neustonicus TaxID=1715348 RepID=A0A501XFP0_9SPHN|nr:hypothetical protein [Sandaracinobacter neustonicus]TPE59421.1 hypothetical protein FJQ54_13065 [Sandaracinobacter neustonicus]